jgi:uncharacterized membrane protein AbrB (regulator of aidB expression)
MRVQLVLCTVVLVALFYVARLPAAVLLGAMAASMIVAGRGARITLPPRLYTLAQAIIGCLIARSLTPALFRSIWQHGALFVVNVVWGWFNLAVMYARTPRARLPACLVDARFRAVAGAPPAPAR